MDFDAVADELYGLPLGEFTSARNARAKQARAEGERELATAIQALSKPTTAAWLVNQLSRAMADELRPLIDLGRELRDASAGLSGDDLRTLTRQRHEVVHALVQRARRIGGDAGHRVSDDVAGEVQRTLEASLADPEVADAVLAGRMSRAAEYAGFGVPVDAGVRQASAERAALRRDADITDLAVRRRGAAERALEEAAQRLEAMQEAQGQAERDRVKAADELESAQQEASELRAALDQAERRTRDAEEADRAARERLEHAETDARAVERAYAEARRALRDLPSQ